MSKTERNANIELLRIISMFMVLVLHALSYSGALDYLNGLNFYLYWWVEALSVIAVDIFVLISGYFLVDSKFKLNKMLNVLGVVWSYSFILTILQTLFIHNHLSLNLVIKALFPVFTKKYWFVNSYILLYIISPFLNKLIHSISKKALSVITITAVICFSIRLTVSPLTWTQDSSGGMGILLFVMLYFIAAWLKKCYVHKGSILKYLLAYFASSLLLLTSKKIFILTGIGANYSGKFYGYASIFVVIEATALFLLFLNKRPLSAKVSKFVNFIAKYSFSVYIIHFTVCGVLFTKILHLDKFIGEAYIGLPAIFISMFTVFFICIILDIIRALIFDIVSKAMKKTSIAQKYSLLCHRFDSLLNSM